MTAYYAELEIASSRQNRRYPMLLCVEAIPLNLKLLEHP